MRSRYVSTNGIRLFCLESGPADGPVVLLLHGFPELAYSWRHQVATLGDAGFHVIAPDMPGYGRSDKPDVTYDCEWINECLIGVLDEIGCRACRRRGPRLGRPPRLDHGAPVSRSAGRRHRRQHAGPSCSAIPPVQLLRQIFVDTPIYIIQFQEPGVAEWMLGSWGRGADDFVEMIFGATTHNRRVPAGARRVQGRVPPIGALTPPIEYYRNMDRNWELTTAIADRTVDVPCLMISAENDPVLMPAMTARHGRTRARPRACDHRELRPLDQQERPEETSRAMLAYLRRLPPWR